MACDSLGRPVRFLIAAGQSHDILAVPALLERHRPAAVFADRVYDANSLRRPGPDRSRGRLPPTRSRKAPIALDPLVYRLRNRVERCFNKLKHFRCLATRFDTLAHHYLAIVHIAASMLWTR